MPYLTQKSRYASIGDFVTVENRSHGDVLICKNDKGVLFPCHVDKLSKPVVEVVEVVKPVDLFNQI
jgi:hypothetical protein